MKLYKSYKFKDYDPILDQLEEVLYTHGMTKAEISRRSGVSASTLTNWQKKKTRRPSATTINASLHALGYQLTITKKNKR